MTKDKKWFTVKEDGLPKENKYIFCITYDGDTCSGLTMSGPNLMGKPEYSKNYAVIDPGFEPKFWLSAVYAYTYINIPAIPKDIWNKSPKRRHLKKTNIAPHLKIKE